MGDTSVEAIKMLDKKLDEDINRLTDIATRQKQEIMGWNELKRTTAKKAAVDAWALDLEEQAYIKLREIRKTKRDMLDIMKQFAEEDFDQAAMENAGEAYLKSLDSFLRSERDIYNKFHTIANQIGETRMGNTVYEATAVASNTLKRKADDISAFAADVGETIVGYDDAASEISRTSETTVAETERLINEATSLQGIIKSGFAGLMQWVQNTSRSDESSTIDTDLGEDTQRDVDEALAMNANFGGKHKSKHHKRSRNTKKRKHMKKGKHHKKTHRKHKKRTLKRYRSKARK
jgi:hypothetical protein